MASTDDFFAHLRNELQGIRDAGLYKAERIIATPTRTPRWPRLVAFSVATA